MVIPIRKNEDDLLEGTDRLGGWFFFDIGNEELSGWGVEVLRWWVFDILGV